MLQKYGDEKVWEKVVGEINWRGTLPRLQDQRRHEHKYDLKNPLNSKNVTFSYKDTVAYFYLQSLDKKIS